MSNIMNNLFRKEQVNWEPKPKYGLNPNNLSIGLGQRTSCVRTQDEDTKNKLVWELVLQSTPFVDDIVQQVREMREEIHDMLELQKQSLKEHDLCFK